VRCVSPVLIRPIVFDFISARQYGLEQLQSIDMPDEDTFLLREYKEAIEIAEKIATNLDIL